MYYLKTKTEYQDNASKLNGQKFNSLKEIKNALMLACAHDCQDDCQGFLYSTVEAQLVYYLRYYQAEILTVKDK